MLNVKTSVWIGIFFSAASLFAVTSPHGNIKFPCEACHNPASWQVDTKTMTFDHDRTGFPLDGAHRQTDCQDCHKDPVFHRIGVTCMDCHTDIHRGQLGKECERCHTPSSWENRQPLFEKHFETRFPLLGAHARVDCDACHDTDRLTEYANTPIECIGCHAENYHATLDPDHQKARFPTTCQECHQVTAFNWNNAQYQHTPLFPLTGAHQGATCVDCHATTYQGTPNTCYACHQSDYNAAADPDHRAFGFLTDCTLCHNSIAWSPASFDHAQASGFSLNGAHQSVQCNDCHINNQLTGLPRDCYGCHVTDYNATKDPDHLKGQYPHECTICHNENAWSPADFNHNLTAFPLTGAHQAVECSDCHINNVYAGTSTDCYSCHQTDFTGATDPNHVSSNFSHDCSICHSTGAWSPATFDHNATNFPLTGAHQQVSCTDCHVNNVYAGTASDCYSCHQTDFTGATDPNHVSSNFSHDCTICHSTGAWSPATFDHNATNFPLTGAHQQVSCTDCHVNNVYAGTPSDCYSCHQTDFTGVTDPNHVSGNFDHDCTICHSTSVWSPATFDHNATNFPLTGAHQQALCIDCHASGYTNTPSDCYFCHESDYKNTTDPNHASAGFPQSCQDCHNTSNWDQTSWDHDSQYFPIYSGSHRGEWDTCADCHNNAANYAAFECILCHEHNQSDTDRKHREVGNYQYVSAACYNCHPRGRGED